MVRVLVVLLCVVAALLLTGGGHTLPAVAVLVLAGLVSLAPAALAAWRLLHQPGEK